MDEQPSRRTYTTHDNGARPFTVELRVHEEPADASSHCVADVVVSENDYNNGEWVKTSNAVLSYARVKVWIGVSPRTPATEFSGGHGPRFDGNSFLIQPDPAEHTYINVGERISTFAARDAIERFVSPVGNNLVVYSYAVDAAKRHYLFIEEVVLERCHLHADYSEDPAAFCPYDYYYNREGEWYAPLDVVWYSEYDDLDADGLPEAYHLHMLTDMSDEAGAKRTYWRVSKDGKSKVPLAHAAAAAILHAANERCSSSPLQRRLLSPRYHERIAKGA